MPSVLGTAPGDGMAFPEIIQTWMVVFREAGSGFTCLFPIALWKMPSGAWNEMTSIGSYV